MNLRRHNGISFCMSASSYDPVILRAIVERAVPSECELSFRAMFGGIMAYARGRPFASLSNVGVGIRLAEPERSMLLQMDDARALQYEPDSPPSKTYVLLPNAWLQNDNPNARAWLTTSARAAMIRPLPKKRAR